ncbi:hypothetical protein [Jiangella sp. DSM 45060]|nr:hypothetical protein [Jiangella sp. DSM 45060]
MGRGATAVEGYPITTTAVLQEELHVEVARPTPRRVVMRREF